MGSTRFHEDQARGPVHAALVLDLVGHAVPIPGAGDLLLDSICNTLHTKALNRVEKHVQIVTDSFGKDDTVTGAVATALYQHFSQGTHEWKS